MDAVKTGALIAQARKERGFTQRELAEKVYVSVQAVSKWELGKNFPDLTLMEPLAEELGLTVSELLAGERGEQPRDELVRDTLRLGLAQLGPKIKRWKWLFLAAALLLLAVLSGLGYVWVRDNTQWLPQRETVVRELDTSGQDGQIASALGSSGVHLHLYEVTLADDLKECTIQAELWTHSGMEQSWPLMESSAEDRKLFGPRRQLLVLNVVPHSEEWSEEEQRWTQMWFECGLSFMGFSTQGRLTDTITNPYINGGAGWNRMNEPQTVDPEEGAVLLGISIGGPSGGIYAYNQLPLTREEEVYLVVRMYCK